MPGMKRMSHCGLPGHNPLPFPPSPGQAIGGSREKQTNKGQKARKGRTMKLPDNIDYFAEQRKYVGYGDGVWIISKSTSSYGRWRAIKRDQVTHAVYGWTLVELGENIAKTIGQ